MRSPEPLSLSPSVWGHLVGRSHSSEGTPQVQPLSRGGLAAVVHPSGEPRMGLLTRRGQMLCILIRFVAKRCGEGLGR